MSDTRRRSAPAEEASAGGVGRIEIIVGADGGGRVSVFRWRSSRGLPGGLNELIGAEDYDAADRDALASIVARLVAESPEAGRHG